MAGLRARANLFLEAVIVVIQLGFVILGGLSLVRSSVLNGDPESAQRIAIATLALAVLLPIQFVVRRWPDLATGTDGDGAPE